MLSRLLSKPRALFRQQRDKLRWAFMSTEDYAYQAEHILRWATSPTVIEDLFIFPTHEREHWPGEQMAPVGRL